MFELLHLKQNSILRKWEDFGKRVLPCCLPCAGHSHGGGSHSHGGESSGEEVKALVVNGAAKAEDTQSSMMIDIPEGSKPAARKSDVGNWNVNCMQG